MKYQKIDEQTTDLFFEAARAVLEEKRKELGILSGKSESVPQEIINHEEKDQSALESWLKNIGMIKMLINRKNNGISIDENLLAELMSKTESLKRAMEEARLQTYNKKTVPIEQPANYEPASISSLMKTAEQSEEKGIFPRVIGESEVRILPAVENDDSSNTIGTVPTDVQIHGRNPRVSRYSNITKVDLPSDSVYSSVKNNKEKWDNLKSEILARLDNIGLTDRISIKATILPETEERAITFKLNEEEIGVSFDSESLFDLTILPELTEICGKYFNFEKIIPVEEGYAILEAYGNNNSVFKVEGVSEDTLEKVKEVLENTMSAGKLPIPEKSEEEIRKNLTALLEEIRGQKEANLLSELDIEEQLSFNELLEAIDLCYGARVDDERLDLKIDIPEDDSNKRRVKIEIQGGISRYERVFNFSGNTFDVMILPQILYKIKETLTMDEEKTMQGAINYERTRFAIEAKDFEANSVALIGYPEDEVNSFKESLFEEKKAVKK